MPVCHVLLRALLLHLWLLGVAAADTVDPPDSTAVDTTLSADPASEVAAAPADTLTLADCLALAYRHNLGYRADQGALEASQERLRQARSPFALNADAGFTLPSYREQRDTFESEALLTRFREENTSFDYRGQVQLSQRVQNLGRFSVTGVGFRSDFSSNRRQDFLEYSGDLQFGYRQQLFTEPDEELQLRQAELSLAGGRSTLSRQALQLESQVTNAFYDLVQGIRQLQIQRQRLEQSAAALDLARRKFEIGLIAEVQALRLEVEKLRAEAAYAQAATAIESRRDLLRQVLAMDMDSTLEVSTDVTYELYPIDEATAVEVGLARRTDVEQARIQRSVGEIDLQLARQRVGPSAVLNAGVTIRGRGPDPGDVGRTLERSLLSTSIDLNLPLVDGGQRRGLLRQAEIDLEQSRLSAEEVRQRVIREVREAVRSVKEAERQIRLRGAALEVAQRTFEVENSRFELGLVDSQQLLIAQTDLTAARTDALDAVVSYQRALQSLRLATMARPQELTAAAE